MGFDSELEDSGSECDVEGQRQNAIKTAILGKFLGENFKILMFFFMFFFFFWKTDSPDHLPIFEDQLLDGLQLWLDRLFEGIFLSIFFFFRFLIIFFLFFRFYVSLSH